MFEYAVNETDAADFATEDIAVELELGSRETAPLTDDSLNPRNESIQFRESEETNTSPPAATIENVISITGLEAMIRSFLGGIGEYSRADIDNLFSLVDTDESGYIDKDEFGHFMDLATGENLCDDDTALKMSKVLRTSLCKQPSTRRLTIESLMSVASKNESMIGDESTIQYMENLAGDG